MFLYLLLATLLLAFAVSWAVARMFSDPLDRILQRLVDDDISAGWSRYLRFAILVVGISAGVRIHELERYITPLHYMKEERTILALTAERWVLELYRTVIEALQGIAWMLLVFFVFALVAYVVVRIGEARAARKGREETRPVP